MPPVLSREDFIAALREKSQRYWDRHPFHQRMHDGELSKEELATWAANRWYYQAMLPQKDAAILSNCPLREVRVEWRQRLAYHDGSSGADGLSDSGADRWLRLCTALGLDREEVTRLDHLAPGVRFAVDAYVNFARQRPWTEGVASGLTEMFAGGLMKRRVTDMLRHYPWISAQDLSYFTNRIDAVSQEGRSTLDIVVAHCITRQEQDAAIAALSFKCEVLWSMLDSIAMRCQPAMRP